MRIIGECPICHHENEIFEGENSEFVQCLACMHCFPEEFVIEEQTTAEMLAKIERELIYWID
jgi:hypothetical protein